jgi:hypothetical protein
MKKADVEISGIRPIWFHAFRIEQISSLSKVKSGSAGNDPEEWKRTVLEKNGQLYLPGSYWTSCLKEASKYTKIGRGSIQKIFISTTLVLDDFTLLDRFLPEGWEKMSIDEMEKDSSNLVYLDIRGVMNPNSKGRNIRYRIACCPGWKTKFSLSFDDTFISPAQMKQIIQNSGKMIGIGDGRVLGNGRFEILDCKISDF